MAMVYFLVFVPAIAWLMIGPDQQFEFWLLALFIIAGFVLLYGKDWALDVASVKYGVETDSGSGTSTGSGGGDCDDSDSTSAPTDDGE
ncbi:hypothetical protein [Natronorarus salvus]|uniref:hypothetical protein n=1 Tax=Natronorarus salvus TaxID=3117733 RepID=UPI002F263B98